MTRPLDPRRAAPALARLAGLVLPVDCAGCGRPDVPLCPACRSALAGPVRPVRLGAWPNGPPAWAGAAYEGAVRRVVVAWKDHGRHDLTSGLGAALARALAACPDPAASAGPSRSVVIVPVPSRRAARRHRGADLVGDLALDAARRVRAGGRTVRVVPALHVVRTVSDQAGLGRAARRANLDGALGLRSAAARAVAGRPCVVVDDVITTGVTVREASRALGEAGGVVVGVAACCATPLVGGLSGGPRLH